MQTAQMMHGNLGIVFESGIATLTLSNSAKRNAVTTAMWRAILKFSGSMAGRKDVRAVIVQGEGDLAFSSGADISEFAELRSRAHNAREYDDLVEDACSAFESISQPTIALIKGACVGAGVSLALSCDLRVADQKAFLALPAADLGLGYDLRGIARLVRVLGASVARHVVLTGEHLQANRAFELGAIHAVAPEHEASLVARKLARTLAAKAPLTICAAKAAIGAIVSGVPELHYKAAELYAAANESADYEEGRRAFLEKRSPRFSGG